MISGKLPSDSHNSHSIPRAWSEFQTQFAKSANVLSESKKSSQQSRKRVLKKIDSLRAQLAESLPTVKLSEHLPDSMTDGIQETIKLLRNRQRELLNALANTIEDFEHAQENEDRFVILTFGEVNAGKSALSNHLAGFDYDDPPIRGDAFVDNETVVRLEEKPTECTRQYQGFRLPGLLWIDCPGVLSGTFANAELARRLVARADFLVFVSSSDAPFKSSEMKELATLIKDAGREKLDACLVVTKADRFETDEDPQTGREIRRLIPKPLDIIETQDAWGKEQLKSSGLHDRVRIQAPLAVSVYVARDVLGRKWDDGNRFRLPPANWETLYDASGLPKFFDLLGKLVREHGAHLKAQWPRKRATAWKRLLKEKLLRSTTEIDRLLDELKAMRTQLANAERDARRDAASSAASRVRGCLAKHGVHRLNHFDHNGAQQALQEALIATVQKVTISSMEPILDQVRKRLRIALGNYIQNTNFNMEVRTRYKTHTYYSTKKSEAVAGAAGGAAGGLSGAAIGTSIFPGAGTIVGGLLGWVVGGFLGSWGGRAIAKKWFSKKVTTRVASGTNGDEVIAVTQQRMRRFAGNAVKKLFSEFDNSVFEQLMSELLRLRRQVERWRESF